MYGLMRNKMESEVENSDGALIICTPRLKERVWGRQTTVVSRFMGRLVGPNTSVGFELECIRKRSRDLRNACHIIPLLYEGEFSNSVPKCLGECLVRDFTSKE
jgi:hypothetical protein